MSTAARAPLDRVQRPPAAGTALPTFLVIGAMKCGTTSLHHYLGQHPEIFVPSMKETNFFSPPEEFPYSPGSQRIETLADYERLYDPAFAVRGDTSPSYADAPRHKGVPERIKAVLADAKLIYLVRDPIARTLSHYHHRVSVEREERTLAQALGELSDPCSPYTCSSFYARQLEAYLRHFPQERILVVDQTDLLRDRRATLREIFAFLSVDESFVSPEFEEEFAKVDGLRTYTNFVILVRRARATPLQRLPRSWRVFMRDTVTRLLSQPLAPAELDEDLRTRLAELYDKDANALRRLTGKTFPTWSV
jgi:hypothetical protein